ncbi:MAG: nucleotidyltransferase family protein [Clostridia bacterium]|nr:nucleotidyltransferase family protein [Clostridia bacterium]
MDKNEAALLELIKMSLFDLPPHFPEGVDWQKVLDEAKAQTVAALVARAVPKEFSAAWEICAAQSQAHFMRILYEQTKLVELLQGGGIPFVILKGTAAAVYYPVPSIRTMGDIDLLVAEDRFEAAFSLLENSGYQFEYDFGDGRDYTFSKGGIVFELHRRYSDEKYDIEEYLINGIKNARTVTLYGNPFPALPEAENALVLLDHIRHHIWVGFGLRQIVDFMMWVSSVKDEKTFESEFLPLFEQAGLDTLARTITKMCKKYLGLPSNAAWCDSADDETCKELLETVLLSGNFGRKNPYEERPLQGLTMSIKRDGFFKTLQKAGVENCPAFKKYKFLRPFAWIYQAFRYIKKGIAALFHGDTFAGDISSGKEKADLYKKLGVK